MIYKIQIEKKAKKFLKQIPKRDALKLLEIIDGLQEDPRPRWVEKLKGTKTDLFRVPWGNYRILYTIEDHLLLVSIEDVDHRKNVYSLL